MRRVIPGVLILIGTMVFLSIASPEECGACPPILWETELVRLSIESITVDGLPTAVPAEYEGVELSVFPARISADQLWITARRDSLELYFAAYVDD